MTFIKQRDGDADQEFFHCDMEHECGGCHSMLNAVTAISPNDEGRPPRENDLTVCAHCGQIMIFNADVMAVMLDLDKMMFVQDLPQWPEVEEASRRIKENPLPME